MSVNIADSVLQALQADAALMLLMDSTAIYATMVPANVLASRVWIAMQRVSGQEESSHSGDDGLSHPRYQFTIGGTDKLVIDKVRDLLVKYNGKTFTDRDGNNLVFFHLDDQESIEEAVRVYVSTVDLVIWVNT